MLFLPIVPMSEPSTAEPVLLPTDQELVLKVIPMPADCNANGDIFGGWVMAQVDLAGAVLPARLVHGRIATVAVNEFVFKQPVRVGDILSFFASVARIGHSPEQAEAFTAAPMHGLMLRSGPALSKGIRAPVAARPARAAVALRMQSEDDKAKASGVALALFGFVASGFSVFFAVLAGGLGIYAGESPVCA